MNLIRCARLRYQNLAVKYKLRLIITVTVISALLPTSAGVVAYDQLSARKEMRNDLEVLAEIVAPTAPPRSRSATGARPRNCSRG